MKATPRAESPPARRERTSVPAAPAPDRARLHSRWRAALSAAISALPGAAAAALAALGAAAPAAAQIAADEDATRPARLEADPTAIALDVGSSMLFRVIAYDAQGNVVDVPIRMRATLDALRVENWRVHALRPGDHAIVATVPGAPEPLSLVIPVSVGLPPIARVEVDHEPGRLYVGTSLRHSVRAYERDGSLRPDPVVYWSTSDPRVATVDEEGNVTAVGRGQVTISADVDGFRATVVHEVAPLPATRLEFVEPPAVARTGDVLHLRVRALDGAGQPVPDVPVAWRVVSGPGEGAAATVEDGRFVANEPGTYAIAAAVGELEVTHTIVVPPRDVEGRAVALGRGRVDDQQSVALRVFRGRDGAVHALTGSWLGDGDVYLWNVTDPAAIPPPRSVRVDARGVRDIDVSPDARYAVFSREGASNRKNGLVIVDVSMTALPRIAAVLDHGVADDAHGVFATDYHVYAVSADREIVVLDMENIYAPRVAGSFAFPDPEIRVRDLHVEGGLAAVAALGHGVAVLDVGDGRWGGSPASPALVALLPAGPGRVHQVLPYRQASTGASYLFLAVNDTVGSGGEVRVLAWPEPGTAREVARYRVAGHELHGIAVEGDRLYAAYGDGGLHVVDVSGELMGDLHAQGRLVAVFVPEAADAATAPGAPVAATADPVVRPSVRDVQAFAGHVYAVDRASGLWLVGIEAPSP